MMRTSGSMPASQVAPAPLTAPAPNLAALDRAGPAPGSAGGEAALLRMRSLLPHGPAPSVAARLGGPVSRRQGRKQAQAPAQSPLGEPSQGSLPFGAGWGNGQGSEPRRQLSSTGGTRLAPAWFRPGKSPPPSPYFGHRRAMPGPPRA